MKKLYPCGLLLALLPAGAAAQQLFSPSHSNYAGLTGTAWNPATVADNRYLFQVQLLALDGHGTNSAYRYTGPGSLLTSPGSADLSSNYLRGISGSRPKLFSLGLNMRGPGLLVSAGAKQGFAINSRVRTAFQGNQIGGQILQAAVDKFDVPQRLKSTSFNLNLNAFAEWNATYGRVLLEKEHHFLKAGVTLKLLRGIGSAYLQTQDADIEIVRQTSQTGDTIVRVNSYTGAFAYSNPQAFDDITVDKAVQWLTLGKAPGAGWGTDVGFVYEYRPSDEHNTYTDKQGKQRPDLGRNKYRYRISASITDIGSLRYREQAVAYNDINVRNRGVSEADLSGIDADNFDEKLNRIFQTQQFARASAFRVGLPTALNLDVDYRLNRMLFANLAVSQSLRPGFAKGMRHFSYAALTPRLETRWLELATPISLNNNYQLFSYGALVRVGPLAVGSNNLSALFASNDPYGVNAYAEFSLLAWAHKKHRNKLKPPIK
ncbi:DUF5723 family protein [Hymenobacter sp. UYP22]|uniref:DUF5723 family protein n=1 Tax=Hymenobacter sp. UYP22 TaxID=3156348 RepID=UPI0033975702